MIKHVRTALAVLVTLGLPAQAVAGSLAIPIKVGLDNSTQRFLNHYPTEIREQLILALEQAIPLIEQGVDHTLDRVDRTIQTTLDRVVCITPAAGDTLGQTGKRLKAIIVGGDQKYGRTDLTDLQKFADLQRKKIGGSSTTKAVEGVYGNILGSAYATHCFYMDVDKKVDLLVKDISDENLGRLDVWMYLDALQCGQATACYSAAYAETKAVVGAADPRDVVGAKANERFANLPVPDPAYANGFNIKATGWFAAFQRGKFEIASYEANVKEMIAVQFDLAAQNAARVQRAKKMLDADAEALKDAKAALAPLGRGYDGSSSAALAQAFGSNQANGKEVSAAFAAIDIDAALSVATAPELKNQADAMKADLARFISEIVGYLRGYGARYAKLVGDEEADRKRQQQLAVDRVMDRLGKH